MAGMLVINNRGDGEKTASSGEYLEYVLDLLGVAGDIEYRKMMGEYTLHH